MSVLNILRKRFIAVSPALALACLTVASASAQSFSVSVSFDETGKGLLTNTLGFSQALPGVKIADPGPGGLNSVLFYGTVNPPGLVAGDLLLQEPGAGSTLSDLLRFDPRTGGGGVFVYSDNSDGADSLADVGFPTALNTNNLTETEVGPESGPNGFTYTPTAGQPGFVAGSSGPTTYTFTSDPAPEPASALLVIPAAAALLLLRARRRPEAA